MPTILAAPSVAILCRAAAGGAPRFRAVPGGAPTGDGRLCSVDVEGDFLEAGFLGNPV